MRYYKPFTVLQWIITLAVIAMLVYAHHYINERGKFTRKVRYISDLILANKVTNTSNEEKTLLFSNCRQKLTAHGYSEATIDTKFGKDTTRFSPALIQYVFKSLGPMSMRPVDLKTIDSLVLLTVEVWGKPNFNLTLTFIDHINSLALVDIDGLPELIERVECYKQRKTDAPIESK